MTFHKLVLEKKVKWQLLPVDMYIKAKQRKDGILFTANAVTKFKDLEDATEVVRSNNKGAAVLPEGELMEGAGNVMGFSSRSGLLNLYGATAILDPSSQWSCTQSTPSVTSQRPPDHPVEEIVARAVEERIRPELSQIHERMGSHPQHPQEIDTRLSRIEETNTTLAEQMRMIIQLL